MGNLFRKAGIFILVVLLLNPAGSQRAKADVFVNCVEQTDIPTLECEALVALYESTNGAGWVNNTGWLQTDTPSTWYGVTYNGEHVTYLDLSNNQLSGTLPTQIGDLSGLLSLSLANNQIGGSIPAQLANLTNLFHLSLQNNRISSNIPAQLGNLSNLVSLSLYANMLSGSIPASFTQLTNLRYAFFQNNHLSGYIPSTGLENMTNLFRISLGNNHLIGDVPEEYAQLVNLETGNTEALSNNRLNTPALSTELGNFLDTIDPDWSDTQFPGLISGHVTGPGSIALPNMAVSITDWSVGYATCTDMYGQYWVNVGVNVGWYIDAGENSASNRCGGSTDYARIRWNQAITEQQASTVTLTSVPYERYDIDFQLDLGGRIPVYIYRSDGTTPVQGACFEVYSALDQGFIGGGGPTGPDGSYTIYGVPAGEVILRSWSGCTENLNLVDVWYSEGGGVLNKHDATPLTIAGGQVTDSVVFSLSSPGSISGRVLKSGGTVIQDVPIRVSASRTDNGRTWTVDASAETGDFLIDELPPGPYTVSANSTREGFYTTETYPGVFDIEQAEVITVDDGQAVTQINFMLDDAGRISGTIQRDDDSPVQGSCVVLHTGREEIVWWGSTDSDGYFEIGGLPPVQTYIFTKANCQGDYPYLVDEFYDPAGSIPDIYQASRVTILAGQEMTGINFSLGSGGSISGQVYEEDGITPISGVSVAVENALIGKTFNAAAVDTNGDGSFMISGLPVGNYNVVARYSDGFGARYYIDGNDRLHATQVEVKLEENTPDIDINMSPEATISGYVYASGGQTPIPGVTLMATPRNGGEYHFAQTDENGFYTIHNLSTGDIVVLAEADGYESEYYQKRWDASSALPVAVQQPNNTPEINFSLYTLGPRYAISGTIMIGDTPLEGVTVSDSKGHTATSEEDGVYTLEGLAPDSYILTPSKPNYVFTPGSKTVDLTNVNVSGQDFSTGYTNTAISLTAQSVVDRIQLAWSSSNNPYLSTYRVWRATPTADSTYVLLGTVNDVQTFDANELIEGQTYCYKIEPVFPVGTAPMSNPACASSGNVTLWTPDAFAAPGQNLVVPVNIRNATGIRLTSAEIWLDFDPAVLECKSVENTVMTHMLNWTVNCDNMNGRAQVSTTASPVQTIYGNGSLFLLNFRVVNLPGNTSPLDLKEYSSEVGGSELQVLSSGSTPVSAPLALMDGLFSVEDSGMLGDVNDDDAITIADADLAQDIAVGYAVPSNKEKFAADVNGDGTVSTADVNMIIYFIANQSWPAPQVVFLRGSLRVQTVQAAVVTQLDDVQGEPGDTLTVNLRAENLVGWAGGDWVLAYDPAVITEVVSVTPGGFVPSARLAYRDDGNGKLWISLANATPVSGSGVLAVITIKIADQLTSGNSRITIAEARLSDQYGRDFILSELQGSIERRAGKVIIFIEKVFLPIVRR